MSQTNIAKLAVILSANSSQFSSVMKKSRAEIADINKAVESGQRSMKTFYTTQARAANRTYDEQQIRNETAARIKAMRQEAQRVKINDAVNMKLFGGAPPEEEGKEAGGAASKGFLNELNSQLGKRSTFGKVMKLAMGGGVIGGLALAANQFDALTQSAENYVKALHQGPDEARAASAEMLKAIPIVGSIGDGLARIYEMASGTTGYVAEMNKQSDALETSFKLIAQHQKNINDFHADTIEYIRKERQEQELIGKTGIERDLIELKQKAEDRNTDVEKNRADRIAKAKELDADELKRLKDEAGKIVIPEHFTTSDEYGNTAYDNADQIKLATDTRDTINNRIKAIEKKQADEIAKINEDSQSRIRESEKTGWMNRWQIAKNTTGNIIASIRDGAVKIKEEYQKQADDRRKTLDDLQKQIETNGMTPAQQQVYELQHKQGVTTSEIDAAKKQAKIIDDITTAKEKEREEEQKIKKIREDSITPAMKLKAEVEDLYKLQQQGKITQDEYNAALLQARDDYNKSLPKPDKIKDLRSGELMAGSAEAQALAYNNSKGMTRLSKKDIPEKQLKEQTTANFYLKKIADQTKDANEPLEVASL